MTDLLVATGLHIVLGFVIFAVILFTSVFFGTRIALAAGRPPAVKFAVGFLPAIFILCCLSFISLLGVWAALASAAAILAMVFSGAQRALADRVLDREIAANIGRAAPALLVFLLWLAFTCNPPSASLGSSVFGDTVAYAGNLVNLALHPLDPLDRSVEGLNYDYHFNKLLPIVYGAALAWVPGFDPFLVLSISATVAYFLLLIAFVTLAARDDASLDLSRWAALALASLIAVLALIRVSAIIEAPPYTFLVLISLTVMTIASAGLDWRPSYLAAFVILLLVTTYWSKPVGGVTLLVAAIGRITNDDFGRRDVRAAAQKIAIAAGLLLVHAWIVTSYHKLYMAQGRVGDRTMLDWMGDIAAAQIPHFRTIELFDMPVEFAMILLGFALFRGKPYLLFVHAVVCFVGWGFYNGVTGGGSALIGATIVFGWAVWDGRWRLTPMAWSGAGLLLLALMTRDAYREAIRNFWYIEIVVIAIVLLALPSPAGPSPAGPSPAGAASRQRLRLSATRRIAAALCVVPAAVALASPIAPWRGWLDSRFAQRVLTPADYAVWAAAAAQTPSDALIFTELTGDDTEMHGGWDYYAMQGQRQLYIGGWLDGYLRKDKAERLVRLAQNEAVLTGRRRPGEVTLSRSYGSYFAVVRRARAVPANFERVYANADYAIYRID